MTKPRMYAVEKDDGLAITSVSPLYPSTGSLVKEPFPGVLLQVDFEATGYEYGRAPIFWRWFCVRGRRVAPRGLPRWNGVVDWVTGRQSMRTITGLNVLRATVVCDRD